VILEHETGRRPYPQIAEDGYSAPYLYLLSEETQVLRAKGRGHTERQLKKIMSVIDSGAGQGRGENYSAMIPIRRNFSSPVSHQHFEAVAIHRRNHHFLSKLEFHTSLQIAYLQMDELREGLPAWPTEHLPPDHGWNMEADVPPRWVPGLLDIAAEAGIEHGCYVGTNVPYIGTVDLVFRPKRQSQGQGRLLMVSCKPAAIYNASTRARERVALDALYSQKTASLHKLEDGSGINRQLAGNLEWMRPLASELQDWSQTQLLRDFCGYFNDHAENAGISTTVKLAAQKIRIADEHAYLMFRMGCWLHHIDIDLTRPVQMTRPIRRGAAAVIRALEDRYLGGVQ